MQIVAIGSRVFVTSFQLAGVKGVKVETSAEALTEINKMDENSGIGLVLLSDDIVKRESQALPICVLILNFWLIVQRIMYGRSSIYGSTMLKMDKCRSQDFL